MEYIKFEIFTTTDVEELLAYNLNEAGIEGVEIINNTGLTDEDKESMFIDILPVLKDDGNSVLRFFIPADYDIDKYKKIVQEEIERLSEFFNVGSAKISTSYANDEDWKDKWKEHFKPFYIDDILVTPTWITPDDNSDIIIRIDPGSAFGTGLHETTRLCVRGLNKHIKSGMKVFDIGCGSAILSIVAVKLGASNVVAVDIDENAVVTAKENFDINDISENIYELYTGNIIDDNNLSNKIGREKYDIIVANLLAEIVIAMADKFMFHLKPEGVLITSGILEEKKERVVTALKSVGFSKFEIIKDGDWVSVEARR